jgi:hypothetical protein
MLTLNRFITLSPYYLYKVKMAKTLLSPTTETHQQHIIVSNSVPYLHLEF